MRNEFEDKYRRFLDNLYRENGWEIKRINGVENRKGDLYINGILTEEKGLRYDNSMAYEIIQALELFREAEFNYTYCRLPINALGNQYITKAKEQIWYCETGAKPSSVYKVDKTTLDKFYHISDNFKRFRIHPVEIGYGLTVCVDIPWTTLIMNSVAEQIWNNERQKTLFERGNKFVAQNPASYEDFLVTRKR